MDGVVPVSRPLAVSTQRTEADEKWIVQHEPKLKSPHNPFITTVNSYAEQAILSLPHKQKLFHRDLVPRRRPKYIARRNSLNTSQFSAVQLATRWLWWVTNDWERIYQYTITLSSGNEPPPPRKKNVRNSKKCWGCRCVTSSISITQQLEEMIKDLKLRR